MFGELWLVNRRRSSEGGALREGVEVPPPPYLALCISSIWLFLSCFLSNKPVNVSKECSWVLWAVLANYWTWGRGRRISCFIASWSEVQVDQDLWLASELGEQSCGTEPLICGVCGNSRSLVSELNWMVECWCLENHRTGGWCWKNPSQWVMVLAFEARLIAEPMAFRLSALLPPHNRQKSMNYRLLKLKSPPQIL